MNNILFQMLNFHRILADHLLSIPQIIPHLPIDILLLFHLSRLIPQHPIQPIDLLQQHIVSTLVLLQGWLGKLTWVGPLSL